MDFRKLISKGKSIEWRKIKWYWWILTVFVIVAIVVTGIFFFTPKQTVATTTKTSATYYVSNVTKGSIEITATGSGVLVANPQINLAFSTSGRVGTLNVQVADEVKKGDVLAELENPEKLKAAITSDELAIVEDQQAIDDLKTNAQVNLATAYQTLVTAQQTYDDALLADERTAYARCSKEKNASYLATYEDALEKLTKLSATQYGSDLWITAKNDFDTAEANYKYCSSYTDDEKTSAKAESAIAKLKLEQAQTDYDTLEKNEGIDPQDLEAAQAKLKNDQLQLEEDQSNLEGATITAPIDGTIISIAANQGEVVTTDTYIVMADLNKSKIEVQISEADLNKMAIGDRAEIVFDAVPKQTFTGKVTQINPDLTTTGSTTVITGVIALDQEPVNPANNHLLPLGLNCTVTVINKEADDVLLVSTDALRSLDDETYGVFVLGNDNVLRFQTVEVGIKNSTKAEIKSGLSLGDIVSTGTAKAAK